MTRSQAAVFILVGLSIFQAAGRADMQLRQTGLRFEIRLDPAVQEGNFTGRVYLALSRTESPSPIQQAGPTGAPLFGVNVEGLQTGQAAIIDEAVMGHPLQSLHNLPPGDYWVQAFANIYTRFDRSDGHSVWLHMDQWEGQDWRISPGNLYCDPVRVALDPARGDIVKLICNRKIPPVRVPPDTEYVKHVKIKSEILSKWWGQPIYIGATILLPKDFDKHPEAHYPVHYSHGHFSLGAPGGFGRGGSFDRSWLAPETPRFLYVAIQHPSPYYDDSYGVNSANNGPYGDAIHQELIPLVEQKFRALARPWARLLSGGSTGGWIALAYQVFYPDFYGGVWASCPDPVDFRAHQIVNIFTDANAYWLDKGWTKVERPNQRRIDGSIVSMMKDENWFELVQGDHSRSGGQWDIWEATFSPVGEDGYPKPLWDKQTGVIDHSVAAYWKTHYDLRYILESNWAALGPRLAGKLHVYVGDMDSFYLNNAVQMLDDFLSKTSAPPCGCEVAYQRRAPHCWGPGSAELIQKMTGQVEKNAPSGADLSSWRYR